jgi:BirA family biotin operon repressor/biotin-[acetyl-CoA-carboxylase] ligase
MTPDEPPVMQETRHLGWGADALWRQLEPLLPGLDVQVVARIESTNSELLGRARHAGSAGRADDTAPRARREDDSRACLLVAEHQTRGRGRLGRDWVASPGASLTFSLMLPLAPVTWTGLSLAVGSALAEALDTGPVPRIGLKWPNDLWLLDGPGRGRKLGGILIETVNVGTRRMAVVGIGLNVQAQPADGLSHGSAGLVELDAGATAPAALATIAQPLVRALQRFEAEGFLPFRDAFLRRDLLAGRTLVTTGGGDDLEGTGEGVDNAGALLLRLRDGSLRQVVSGEVSVRLQPTDPGTAPC